MHNRDLGTAPGRRLQAGCRAPDDGPGQLVAVIEELNDGGGEMTVLHRRWATRWFFALLDGEEGQRDV
ncbi:MAG: hypothetical protein M3Y91_16130 [Actinomycetota bacterium]|nr:hypothetical protein [Actinomycetota bacterium]